MGASPARRHCRSMRRRSLVAPNATQKARPENLVVAATAIAEASPFPRQLYQNAARMSRGAEGTTEASGRRDQAGLAARKRRVGAVRGAVPAQNEPKSDRPRAKTPMNRRKSRLRRRAAPILDARKRACRADLGVNGVGHHRPAVGARGRVPGVELDTHERPRGRSASVVHREACRAGSSARSSRVPDAAQSISQQA